MQGASKNVDSERRFDAQPKDWSHVELVEIKEFNRLIELSVDISVSKAWFR